MDLISFALETLSTRACQTPISSMPPAPPQPRHKLSSEAPAGKLTCVLQEPSPKSPPVQPKQRCHPSINSQHTAEKRVAASNARMTKPSLLRDELSDGDTWPALRLRQGAVPCPPWPPLAHRGRQPRMHQTTPSTMRDTSDKHQRWDEHQRRAPESAPVTVATMETRASPPGQLQCDDSRPSQEQWLQPETSSPLSARGCAKGVFFGRGCAKGALPTNADRTRKNKRRSTRKREDAVGFDEEGHQKALIGTEAVCGADRPAPCLSSATSSGHQGASGGGKGATRGATRQKPMQATRPLPSGELAAEIGPSQLALKIENIPTH